MNNIDLSLITDDPKKVKQFGMYQLAHNQFFVKDREAWYRDFDREISCRDLVREIIKKEGIETEPEFMIDDDYFDEEMLECLQYGIDAPIGVIAMYYTAMYAMANIRQMYMEQQEKEKSIINELQEKIKDAQRLIVKNPADTLDEVANDTVEDFIAAYKECLELIQGGKE